MKLAALALTLGIAAITLPAQQNQSGPGEQRQQKSEQQRSLRIFHLGYATTYNEETDVLNAVRNILPQDTRIYLEPSHNEMLISGSPEALQTAQEVLARLDVPSMQYRVTYTLTETDGGKRIGVQHYSMTLASGQRMTMKEGSRIPVMTGTVGVDEPKPSQQMTYLDVGFNFDTTLSPYGTNAVLLKEKIERSALNEQKSAFGQLDPIIRQTMLEGTNVLTVGKPQALGSIDVVGSTRQLEVEALVEQVK